MRIRVAPLRAEDAAAALCIVLPHRQMGLVLASSADTLSSESIVLSHLVGIPLTVTHKMQLGFRITLVQPVRIPLRAGGKDEEARAVKTRKRAH